MPTHEKPTLGGTRSGAGRKKGSSVYAESTQAIRVPESMVPEVKSMLLMTFWLLTIRLIPLSVTVCLQGELTVKRLKSVGNGIILGAENPAYTDITVKEEADFVIWGVVTNVIHPV